MTEKFSGLVIWVYGFLFVSLLLLMNFRSGLFILRTVKEFSQPVPVFHPEITECSTELLETQGQLRGLYNYRSLGKPCQKK